MFRWNTVFTFTLLWNLVTGLGEVIQINSSFSPNKTETHWCPFLSKHLAQTDLYVREKPHTVTQEYYKPPELRRRLYGYITSCFGLQQFQVFGVCCTDCTSHESSLWNFLKFPVSSIFFDPYTRNLHFRSKTQRFPNIQIRLVAGQMKT